MRACPIDIPDTITTEFAVIAAVAENGVIGNDGGMPWHYPEDLKHFQETTTDSVVIMGRTTYESVVGKLDGPLPDRETVVLTSSPERDLPYSPRTATSVVDAMHVAEDILNELESEVAYIAGGESVYKQFLPIADRLILTEIHSQYDGDRYFPEWNDALWTEASRDDREELSFVEYVRDD